jgi:hypothetical protein
MRSEWIKARTDLHEDPIVFRQATALGRSPHEIAYRWLMVWAWARKHTSNGFVPDTDATVIDAASGLPGFASHAGRWIKFTRKGVEFPHWDRHNSNGARERADSQERQNLSRKRHGSVTESCDKSVTRVEQSRAEQKRQKQIQAEPSHAPDSAAQENRPAQPSTQHYTVDYARQCLIGMGISPIEAEQVIAEAAISHPSDGIARIVKGCTRLKQRLDKGKPCNNRADYVQVAGELKQSVKTKVADRRAELSRLKLAEGGAA